MIDPYLLLQADYEGITIGLGSQGKLITSCSISKMDACKKLMVAIGDLLKSKDLKFTDLMYLAANQGPAPFTTLRVVITTANALNFAHKIPLVGIDALQAFGFQCVDIAPAVILLNAFSQDVYFSSVDQGTMQTGWGNHTKIIEQFALHFKGRSVTVVGNAVDLYKEIIIAQIPDAKFLNPNPAYVDLDHLACCAHIQWVEKRNVTNLLEPLYLKTQDYKPSM